MQVCEQELLQWEGQDHKEQEQQIDFQERQERLLGECIYILQCNNCIYICMNWEICGFGRVFKCFSTCLFPNPGLHEGTRRYSGRLLRSPDTCQAMTALC